MQKLLSYLQVLNNWETFGYLLLPKDKGYLVEVIDMCVASCRTVGYNVLVIKVYYNLDPL